MKARKILLLILIIQFLFINKVYAGNVTGYKTQLENADGTFQYDNMKLGIDDKQSRMTTMTWKGHTYYCTTPGVEAASTGSEANCNSRVMDDKEAAAYLSIYNSGESAQEQAYATRLYSVNSYAKNYSSAEMQANGCAYMKAAQKEGVPLSDSTKSYMNTNCENTSVEIKDDKDISSIIKNAKAAEKAAKSTGKDTKKDFSITQTDNTFVYKNADNVNVFLDCSICKFKGKKEKNITLTGNGTLVVEYDTSKKCSDDEKYFLYVGGDPNTGGGDDSGSKPSEEKKGKECTEVTEINCTYGSTKLQSFKGCSNYDTPSSNTDPEDNEGGDDSENPGFEKTYEGIIKCGDDHCLNVSCPSSGEFIDYPGEVIEDGEINRLCDYTGFNAPIQMISEASFYEENPEFIDCCVLNGETSKTNILKDSNKSDFCDEVHCTENYNFNDMSNPTMAYSPFYVSQEDHMDGRDFITAGSYFRVGSISDSDKLKDSGEYRCYAYNHYERLANKIASLVNENSLQDEVKGTTCAEKIPSSQVYEWTCARRGKRGDGSSGSEEIGQIVKRKVIIRSSYNKPANQVIKYEGGNEVSSNVSWDQNDKCSGLSQYNISPQNEKYETCWDCPYSSGSGHYGYADTNICRSYGTTPSCSSVGNCSEYVPDEPPSEGCTQKTCDSGYHWDGTECDCVKDSTEPTVDKCKCILGGFYTEIICGPTKADCTATCKSTKSSNSAYCSNYWYHGKYISAGLENPNFMDRFKDILAYKSLNSSTLLAYNDDNDRINEKYNNALAGTNWVCDSPSNVHYKESTVYYDIVPEKIKSYTEPENGEDGRPDNRYYEKSFTYVVKEYNAEQVSEGSNEINITSIDKSSTTTLPNKFPTLGECQKEVVKTMKDKTEAYKDENHMNSGCKTPYSNCFKTADFTKEFNDLLDSYYSECLGIEKYGQVKTDKDYGISQKMAKGITDCKREVTFYYEDGEKLGIMGKDGLPLASKQVSVEYNCENETDTNCNNGQTNYYCKDGGTCENEVSNNNAKINIPDLKITKEFIMSTYSASTMKVVNEYTLEGIVMCNDYEIGDRYPLIPAKGQSLDELQCKENETRNVGWPVAYDTTYGEYDYSINVNNIDYCLREATGEKANDKIKCAYDVNGCDRCKYYGTPTGDCPDCLVSCIGVGCIYNEGHGLAINYQPISLINIDAAFAYLLEKYDGIQVLNAVKNDALSTNSNVQVVKLATDITEEKIDSRNWETKKGLHTIKRIQSQGEGIYDGDSNGDPEYRIVLKPSDIDEIKIDNQKNGGFVSTKNSENENSLICTKSATVDGYVTCRSRFLDTLREKGKLTGKFKDGPIFIDATDTAIGPGLKPKEDIGRQYNTGPAWK